MLLSPQIPNVSRLSGGSWERFFPLSSSIKKSSRRSFESGNVTRTLMPMPWNTACCPIDMCQKDTVKQVDVPTTTMKLEQSRLVNLEITEPALLEFDMQTHGSVTMTMEGGQSIYIDSDHEGHMTILVHLKHLEEELNAKVIDQSAEEVIFVTEKYNDMLKVVCNEAFDSSQTRKYPIQMKDGEPYIKVELPRQQAFFLVAPSNGKELEGALTTSEISVQGLNATLTTGFQPTYQPKCVEHSCEFKNRDIVVSSPGDDTLLLLYTITGGKNATLLTYEQYDGTVAWTNKTCRFSGDPLSTHQFKTQQSGVFLGLNDRMEGPNFTITTNGQLKVLNETFTFGTDKNFNPDKFVANSKYLYRLWKGPEGHTFLRFSTNPPKVDGHRFIVEELIKLTGINMPYEDIKFYGAYAFDDTSYLLVGDKMQKYVVTIDHGSNTKTITTLEKNASLAGKPNQEIGRTLIRYSKDDGVFLQWLDESGLSDPISFPSIDKTEHMYGLWMIGADKIMFISQTEGLSELVTCGLNKNERYVMWKSEQTNNEVSSINFNGGNAYITEKSNAGEFMLTIVSNLDKFNGGDEHDAYFWSIDLNKVLKLNDTHQKTCRSINISGFDNNGNVLIRVRFEDGTLVTYALNPRTVPADKIKKVSPKKQEPMRNPDTPPTAPVQTPVANNTTTPPPTAPVQTPVANGTYNNTDLIIKFTPFPTAPVQTPVANNTTTPPPAPENTAVVMPKTTPHGAQDKITPGSIIGPIIGASVGGVLGAALLAVTVTTKYRKRLETVASNVQATASSVISSMRDCCRKLSRNNNDVGFEMADRGVNRPPTINA